MAVRRGASPKYEESTKQIYNRDLLTRVRELPKIYSTFFELVWMWNVFICVNFLLLRLATLMYPPLLRGRVRQREASDICAALKMLMSLFL